jgi:dihydrodipicolinate reductase
MADIVSAIASVVTLIQTTGVTGRTISRIRKLHASAPRYIQMAQNEIANFAAALNLLQDAPKSRPSAPSDSVDAEITRLHIHAKTVAREI